MLLWRLWGPALLSTIDRAMGGMVTDMIYKLILIQYYGTHSLFVCAWKLSKPRWTSSPDGLAVLQMHNANKMMKMCLHQFYLFLSTKYRKKIIDLFKYGTSDIYTIFNRSIFLFLCFVISFSYILEKFKVHSRVPLFSELQVVLLHSPRPCRPLLSAALQSTSLQAAP